MRRAALVLFFLGCGSGDDPAPPAAEPSFPAEYKTSYREVRNCRQSNEHDLNRIRILADPAAFGPYSKRDQPFPVGAVLLKEEYNFDDLNCTGPIRQWTLMKRLATGSSPKTLDWSWEQVDSERNVLGRNTARCIGCHAGCTPAEGGYEQTCAVP